MGLVTFQVRKPLRPHVRMAFEPLRKRFAPLARPMSASECAPVRQNTKNVDGAPEETRTPAAELVGHPGLAFADALHLGRVRCREPRCISKLHGGNVGCQKGVNVRCRFAACNCCSRSPEFGDRLAERFTSGQ
jgi:hypothetical protein